LSGNSPRALLPKPGQVLRDFKWPEGRDHDIDGVYGVLWQPHRWYGSSWRARCRCGNEWRLRSRPYNTPLKMPSRCGKCHTRNWFKREEPETHEATTVNEEMSEK